MSTRPIDTCVGWGGAGAPGGGGADDLWGSGRLGGEKRLRYAHLKIQPNLKQHLKENLLMKIARVSDFTVEW